MDPYPERPGNEPGCRDRNPVSIDMKNNPLNISMNSHPLFQPFRLKSLELRDRLVMAPMTRSFSPGGVPTSAAADYYARRAQGETGLILSEGAVVNRPASSSDPLATLS